MTQPRPKSICAEISSAAVVDLGVRPLSRVKPSGMPERCEAMPVTSTPKALVRSKDRPAKSVLLWLAS